MNWVLTGVPTSLLTTLALALGSALVVLYVLRVRRRRVEVPFSPLWAAVLAERKANVWWERLKRLLSLLVQLLLLAVLLLALADPRTEDALQEGRSVVVLVDTSASMQTGNADGTTRFELARARVGEQLDRLGPKDEAMLVSVDGQLRPLTPFTNDVQRLREALDDLRPSATAGDAVEASRFAIDALTGRRNGVIVWATDFAQATPAGGDAADDDPADGGVDAPTDAIALPQTLEWVALPVGEDTDNVGITAFNVRRYPSNRTNVEVFLQLRNQSARDADVEVSLYGSGRLLDVTTLAVPAGGEALRTLPDLPTSGDELEARIRVRDEAFVDRFGLDDVAHARLPDARPLRVLVVTEGNLYLEAPLLLNESIDVTTLAPEAYTAPNQGDPSAGYDVTIFDRVTPDTAETGNFLYLAPEGPYSPWRVDGDVTDPIIDSTRSGHALLRWISALRDVNIASARRLRLDTEDRSVASAIGGAPMVVTRVLPGTRRVGLAFAPEDSDLPLRVAWPVFLLNALDWFTQDDAALIESFATGQTWFVPVADRSVERVDVTSPSGVTRTLEAHHGRVAFYGDEIGFWRLRAGERAWSIAGNLTDPTESRVAPGDPAALIADAPLDALDDASLQLDWDPWMALIGLAFVVFLLEWWTWNRRWTV